jgi:hypothetical protein
MTRPIGFFSSMLTPFVTFRNCRELIWHQCEFRRNIRAFYSAYTMVCHVLQVYGGSVSVMIGAYAWSSIGTGVSSALSAETICNRCSVLVSDTSIANSIALASTSGTVAVHQQAHYRLFFSATQYVV